MSAQRDVEHVVDEAFVQVLRARPGLTAAPICATIEHTFIAEAEPTTLPVWLPAHPLRRPFPPEDPSPSELRPLVANSGGGYLPAANSHAETKESP